MGITKMEKYPYHYLYGGYSLFPHYLIASEIGDFFIKYLSLFIVILQCNLNNLTL